MPSSPRRSLTGSLFASAVDGHWQTYQLWRHRQHFGVDDPLHGKDVGFFVFTLPFLLMLCGLLLWLVVVAAGYVALAHRARGTLGFRPRHATFQAQLHPDLLAAAAHLISSRSALIVFSAAILAVSVIAARLQAAALRH